MEMAYTPGRYASTLSQEGTVLAAVLQELVERLDDAAMVGCCIMFYVQSLSAPPALVPAPSRRRSAIVDRVPSLLNHALKKALTAAEDVSTHCVIVWARRIR